MNFLKKIKDKIDYINPKTELLRGVKCKKCGAMYIPPFEHYLCQSCGSCITNGYIKGSWNITNEASIITVKVIHGLFTDTLKEV